jgi:outer membrane lipoprotein carrier protein
LIRTIAALTLLTSVLPAAAEEAAARDAGRALVNEFVTGVSTLSSRFEQTLIDADGEVLEVTRGTLEINRPGQFRWAYDEPYEQWLVADGLNLWSYDVDLAQVTVKPQADALANTPALLLGGSAAVLDEFEYDGSFEEGGLTWVRMRPVDTDSGFKRLELAFSGRTLARMVFFDNLEQTTLVSLTDAVINEAIDPAHFEFVAPDGVDVVGTPALAESEVP